MKKTLFKNKIICIIVALVLLLSVTVLCATLIKRPQSYLAEGKEIVFETPLKDNYGVNSTLIVGATKVKDQAGVEHASNGSFLIYPDDQVINGSVFSLNKLGVYTLVCSADVEGSIIYAQKQFKVYNGAYSITAGGEYQFLNEIPTVSKSQTKGLEITLNEGSVFTYNKPINISNLTSNDSFITIYPHTLSKLMGASELASDSAQTTVVRLTDCYDSSIYVDFEISFDLHANAERTETWRSHYFRAGANNQRPVGLSVNTTDTKPQWYLDIYYNGVRYIGYEEPVTASNEWGPYGARINVGQECADDMGYGFTYDYETGEIYGKYESDVQGQEKYVFITDVKSEDIYGDGNAFKGFTTGEVYLSIFGNKFFGNQLKVDVANILDVEGEDLNAEFALDTVSPVGFFPLDTNMNMVIAKDEEISLVSFDAIDVSGVKEITSAVYYEYGSTYQSAVNCVDGKFIPNKIGAYTAVYKVVDVYGNYTEILCPFVCKDVAGSNAIALEFSGEGLVLDPINQTSVLAGKDYTLQDFALNSINDVDTHLSISQVFVSTGESVEINQQTKKLSFDRAGEYKLVFTYGDTLYNYTKEFKVKCNPSSEIKIETPVLPKYFIKGAEYTLDVNSVIKFEGDNPVYVAPEVYKKQNGGVDVRVDDYSAFVASEEGVVVLEYRHDDTVLFTSDEIPVIDVNFGGNIKLEKYFACQNVDLSKDSAAINFAVENGKTSANFNFINALSYNNFSIEFFVSKITDQAGVNIGAKTDFDEFAIIFTDYYDRTNVQEIVYENRGEQYAIKHGGLTYVVNGKFTDNQKISFNKDDNYFATQSSLTIPSVCNFSSDRVLVSFEIRGASVSGNAGVSISFLCTQKLGARESADSLKPMITKKAPTGTWEIGSTISFAYAEVADVLSPYSIKGWSLSVVDEKGNYMVDKISGKTLRNVNALQDEFAFEITAYGTYSIVYLYKDQAGNQSTDTSTIIVSDVISPEITLNGIGNGGTVKVGVGKELTLFSYTVKDNQSSAENVRVSVSVENSNNIFETVTSTMKFTPMDKGTYTVRYFVYDEVGNYTTAYYYVVVE